LGDDKCGQRPDEGLDFKYHQKPLTHDSRTVSRIGFYHKFKDLLPRRTMPKRLLKSYLTRMRERYQNAPKDLKSSILTEFCENSRYSRKHAIRILNGRLQPRTRRPGPKAKYNSEVVHHLRVLWESMGRICSKKMKSALPLWLPFYKDCSREVKEQLMSMAASTIDKKLHAYRGPKRKGIGTTRGLKIMMKKIPLKVLGDKIKEPGFMESDTVAHCGDNIAGEYAHSLTMTDLYSGWTENAAVWTKDSDQVLLQVRAIEKRMPFKLVGFASDNGSEFMNQALCNYLFKRPEPVSFVRSRPYQKNDNAHVEQKNFTHVRELFGYERLDDFELTVLMNEIYQVYWSTLQNYFIPNLKLISKERYGSKIKKKYDTPQTPCQRLLSSEAVDKSIKKQLRHNLKYHNPFFLRKELESKLKIFFHRVEEIKRKKLMTGS